MPIETEIRAWSTALRDALAYARQEASRRLAWMQLLNPFLWVRAYRALREPIVFRSTEDEPMTPIQHDRLTRSLATLVEGFQAHPDAENYLQFVITFPAPGEDPLKLWRLTIAPPDHWTLYDQCNAFREALVKAGVEIPKRPDTTTRVQIETLPWLDDPYPDPPGTKA